MATIQCYPMRVTTGTTTTPTYLDGVEDGSSGWAADSGIKGVRIRAAGVAQNLIVKLASAPAAGKSIAYTFQIWDGAAFADTSLVATVSDANTTGVSTGTASVAVGDLVRWKRTHTGSPTLSAMLMTWELHHTTNNLNVYMGTSTPSTGSVHRVGLFRCGHSQAAIADNRSHIVSAPGTLTELDYTVDVAPGSGNSWTLVFIKNNVVQDGAGGTTNTTVVISDAATTGRWTGSIAMGAADRGCIQITPASSPAGAVLQTCVLFTPTTDGEANICNFPGINLATSGTTYYIPSQDSLTTSGSADADVEQLAAVTPMVWSDMRIRTDANITTGPVAFTLRKNGASTAITDSITSGQQVGEDTTNTASTTSGDTIAMQYVATGTPGIANGVAYSFTTFALAAAPITGSLVAGVNTRVTATRAIAFGLDEATSNLHDESGKFKVFGQASVTEYFELEESSAPSGVANKGRIWVEDNGAGKTRLMVQFGSGAAQQIAIEP